MLNDVQVSVITLKRSQERFKLWYSNLAQDFKDNLNIFYGIDGRLINRKEYLNKTSNSIRGKLIPTGVLGCALSHILLWKDFLDSTKEYLLIFEDDVYISEDYINIFYEHLNTVKEISKYGLVFLKAGYNKVISEGSIKKFNSEKIKLYNEILKINKNFRVCSWLTGFGCYFISKNTAQKLVDYYEKKGIDTHIDYSVLIHRDDIDIFLFFDDKLKIASATRLPSTMTNFNEKTLLKTIKNKTREGYYNIKIPRWRLNNIETTDIFKFLLIALLIIIIINVIINFKQINYTLINIILILLYFITGVMIWDVIELFYVF